MPADAGGNRATSSRELLVATRVAAARAEGLQLAAHRAVGGGDLELARRGWRGSADNTWVFGLLVSNDGGIWYGELGISVLKSTLTLCLCTQIILLLCGIA